jgi:LuxR family maltose regulon positive regulatory protein
MPLLRTKVHIPASRQDLVQRPHLLRRLDEGLRPANRLLLVSAPAGYGKTTLLTAWIRSLDLPTAWLSLGPADNDPVRFWRYVSATLQTLEIEIPEALAESSLLGVQSAGPFPTRTVLTGLINALAKLSRLILVLDDYHLIDNNEIDQALGFLLEHQPPQLLLVLATRKDPHLPLSRLRARGQLTEIRVTDLRFTPSEASAFFEQTAGLSLAPDQASALATRTEGWIAGLQLASLALRQQPSQNIASFVQAFAGSHRFVLDYLLEEVLQQQDERIQAFLLQTSILERLNGDLCDAVLAGPAADGEDSQQVLEQLEAANLFILPMDDERLWFRYHRLFADLLRARLDRDGPRLDCAPAKELHRRASAWYSANGYPGEAIGHALAAGDLDSAAQLIEGQALLLLTRGELTTLLRWLAALPEASIQARPWLSIYYAWALVLSGQTGEAERRLEDVEAASELGFADYRQPAPSRPEVPTAELQPEGHIAAIRSYIAAQRGDMGRTVELAQRALDTLAEEDLVVRSVVAFTLGITHLACSKPEAAARAFAQASDMGQASGNVHLAVPAAGHLAELEVQQGHLHRAFETYRGMLDLAEGSPVSAQAHSGLSQLWLEWNNLALAGEHLTRSIELGRTWGNLDALCGDYALLSWLRHVEGCEQAADDALREAKRLASENKLHPRVVALLAATKARLAVARNDLAPARRWLHDIGLDAADDPLRQREAITVVRVLLALGEADQAAQQLARLLAVAKCDGFQGFTIELLALQALVHKTQGDQDAALEDLEQALTLAEPEGYVRTFVDEGEPMAELISALSHRASGPSHEYVAKLLAAFEPPPDDAQREREPEAVAEGLVEALSERELEVLRLVAAGLTNQEIADELVIAVSTVKSHTNHIYGKLGVKNRTQAIAQARSLRLL